MSDPITPALVGPVVAGVGAAMLTYLGLQPDLLFWALAGATIGLTFATAAGPVRTWVTFAAVVFISSLLGAWLAQRYMADEVLSRRTFSCVIAVFFHVILNATVARVPALLDKLSGLKKESP